MKKLTTLFFLFSLVLTTYSQSSTGNCVKIWTQKKSFAPNETVNVFYSGMSGSSSDWIALAEAYSPTNKFVTYKYTAGKLSGNIAFANIAPGNYELRAYFANTYDLRASTQIVISNNSSSSGSTSTSPDSGAPTGDVDADTNVSLRLNKQSYASGEPVIVSYSGMYGSPTDWIAITRKEIPVSTYDYYQYTSGNKNGNLTFSNLPNGIYEARAYFNNTYTLKARKGFVVGNSSVTTSDDTTTSNEEPNSTTTRLWTDKTNYPGGATVTVNFSGMMGATTDWVAITLASKPSSSYDFYKYTEGKKSGRMDFSNLPDGIYEARAYFNNSYTLQAKYRFTVGNAVELPPDNPFVQLPPPANTSGNEWKVDYGPFEVNGAQIDAKPTGDGKTSYYIAPNNYHGNWTGYKQLVFEKKSWGGSYYGPTSYGGYGDIVIKNGNKTARYDITKDHSGQFRMFTIPLSGSNWKLSGGAGSLQEVLSNVTEFKIRAEYGSGTDYSSLKNVALVQ